MANQERRRPKRRPSWIKKSGPYKCVSLTNSHILVDPSWPQYGPVWDGGGGPGFPGRMVLAAALQDWLNAPYSEEEIAEGMARIEEHERNLRVSERRLQRRIYELEETIKRQDRRIVELEMELERLKHDQQREE